MSGIKKLAGQTLWYGVPTITSRFLGYATNIFLFWLYKPSSTAAITQIYAVIPFLNIVFTYGLETSYFRFAQTTNKKHLYNLFMSSIIVSTILFTAILIWQAQGVADLINMPRNADYVRWMAWILFFDTLSVIPFAKLRQEGRPRRFAFIKVLNILTSVFLTVYFLGVCPKIAQHNPDSIFLKFYNSSIDIGYYIIANIVASIITLILLFKEFIDFKFEFEFDLWKKVMNYSYPLIIVGFGGMINELLSRLVYTRVVKLSYEEAQHQLGVFGANFKVAVLITIFIQVFRMGAEPFFFNKSKDDDAKKTYARVMKFFVIACCFMWLAIATNLSLIKYFAYGSNAKEYSEGLSIIPILSMGSVFLGIYYNLTIWYKLTNKTMYGAWITLAGAVITIVLNIWWIPVFGYNGSAWATFVCYGFMMVISYTLGQKYYLIPYAWKKLLAYIFIVVILFLIHKLFIHFVHSLLTGTIFAFILIAAFAAFILKIEKKEFEKIPKLSKFLN